MKNMGIGDWGLGIGDWGLGPIPNPKSPIPNPQSPFTNNHHIKQQKQYIFNKKYKLILLIILYK